jgi:hypothetical protein
VAATKEVKFTAIESPHTCVVTFYENVIVKFIIEWKIEVHSYRFSPTANLYADTCCRQIGRPRADGNADKVMAKRTAGIARCPTRL